MNQATRDDYFWLASENAVKHLELAHQFFSERSNVLILAKTLRKSISPTRSALVMEIAQLRIRARKKFLLADKMLFNRRGLEQSSGQNIASYKASRFRSCQRIIDVCCGIGGDLISIAGVAHDSATGIDQDPICCLFAAHNAKVNGCPRTVVEQISFDTLKLSEFDAAHFDPDRRQNGRTIHGDYFSPTISEIVERAKGMSSWAIKVAPATPAMECVPAGTHREWIGDQRECKQQILWHGNANRRQKLGPGARTATRINNDGSRNQLSFSKTEIEVEEDCSDSLNQYLFEPHPTILAGRMVDALAAKTGLQRLSPGLGFLSGNRMPAEFSDMERLLLSSFRIIQQTSLRARDVSADLRKLGIGSIEIKKRGVEQVYVEQFGKIKLEGDRTATVILTRHQRKRIALIAERVTAQTAS